MPGWFKQNAPKSSGGGWFASNAPRRREGLPSRPVSAEDFTPRQSFGSRFGEELWKRTNPVGIVEGVVEAAKHPVDTAVGLISSDPAFLTQAKEAYSKGHYLTAGRKLLSYAAMGLGHDLDAQAEMIASGDYGGAAGAMAGTATQFLAPEAAARGVAALPGARGIRPANPAVADAARFGAERGVPVDAATATDNAAIRAMQHLSDRSLGGAQIASKALQQQSEGLATLGEQLAAKGYARPVSPEAAGAGVRDALEARINAFDADADVAYGRLRDIAKQNQETVLARQPAPPPADAAPSFSGHLPDNIFEEVYKDAQQNGYTGSRSALRERFDDQLKSGLDAVEEKARVNAEYGPEALLRDIRKLGGIKPFTRALGTGEKLRGDFAAMSESFSAKSSFGQRGGASIFRNEGLGVDDMVDQLRQDPKWRGLIENDTDLLNALDEISKSGPSQAGRPSIPEALSLTDVKPGSQWWIPRVEEMQAIPVDLRSVRSQIAPMHEALMRERELAPMTIMGDKATALQALDTLMKAPDYAPLETVDKALSDIKRMARGKPGTLPALRTEGQGVAANLVKVLDAQVREAAAAAGPEALEALETGRYATKAKYAVKQVYDAIKDEPVKAFDQSVAGRDTAIEHLRAVAEHAPKELPKIGRAYLDGLLQKATAEGGFAHADKLFADWQKMGPETKQLLFGDSAHLRDLDRFFLLAKQMGKNANPSGTAHAAAMLMQGSQLLNPVHFVGSVLGTAGLSKFLHSTGGTRLLTEGLRLPAWGPMRDAWISKVRKFGAAQGVALGTASPATPGQ